MPTEAVVYRLYDESGTLLYVGMTSFLRQRMNAHRSGSAWFGQVVERRIEKFPTRTAACAAEEAAIVNESPLHNQITRSTAVKVLDYNARRIKYQVTFTEAEHEALLLAVESTGKRPTVYIREAAVAKAKRQK